MLLFFGSSALAAVALAEGLQELLPYESFDRSTAAERFLFWEGVAWMTGLALVFFGGSAALGTLHLVNLRLPSLDEFLAQMRRPEQRTPSLVPWWMLSTGVLLLAIAIRARAQLPG
jgi:hypothetical protein